MSFPTNIHTKYTAVGTDKLNVGTHSEVHNTLEDELILAQTKIGVDSSAVTTSHDYKLSGVTGTDKAVSKTGTETLTNKTLTTPVIASFYQDAGLTKLMTIPNVASDTLVTLTASQILTTKTLTTPVINGAVTGTITPPLTFYSTNHNLPEGVLLNGKIVPSVTSNNLTVALKGMDGNDPSASNPVYIRINGVIRSITAALSVTKNAATNWCNSGSTELATKEIDYFVYLGYNATDGVIIGFSRIPFAKQYSDFSVTTTNEKYCAISTITTAASTDYYYIIGRFAATLSAGAGYTWTVPTFTATNLIQRPVYETRFLTYASQVTSSTGTITTVGTVSSKYKIIPDNSLYVDLSATITTNGTGATAVKTTLPFTMAAIAPTWTGRENSVSGKMLQGQAGNGNNYVNWFDYANVYPGANGAMIQGSGLVNIQ